MILESSVAGMVQAGTVNESEENGGKKNQLCLLAQCFSNVSWWQHYFEVIIIKSKLSPLTLAVQVHRGTSGNGVMPV